MLTNKMIEWLREHGNDQTHPYYSLYHQRIQRYLNQQFTKLLTLAKHHPDILLGEVAGIIQPQDSPRHKRIQDLLLVVEILVRPERKVWVEYERELAKVKQTIEGE